MTSTNKVTHAYVKETIAGITPSNPAFTPIPFTSGALSSSRATKESEAINDNPRLKDLAVVDANIAGSLGFELSYGAYKELLTALMRNSNPRVINITGNDISASNANSKFTSTATDFSAIKQGDVFRVSGFGDPDVDGYYLATADGTATEIAVYPAPKAASSGANVTLKAEIVRDAQERAADHSYTIVRRVEGIANPAYFYYRGCVVAGASFSFTTSDIIKGSLNITGLSEEATETPIAGQTFNPMPDYALLNSVDNVALMDIGGLNNSTCFANINLTVNRNTQGAKCIGTLGAKSLSDFDFRADASMSIYFEDLEAYNKFANSQAFSVLLVTEDADGNAIGIYLPRCKFTSMEQPINGKNQFLLLDGGFTALDDPVTNMAMQFSFIGA